MKLQEMNKVLKHNWDLVLKSVKQFTVTVFY